MSVRDTAHDGGLPPPSAFIALPPRRRRNTAACLRSMVRHHAGMGVFLVMLVTSITLVVFSR